MVVDDLDDLAARTQGQVGQLVAQAVEVGNVQGLINDLWGLVEIALRVFCLAQRDARVQVQFDHSWS